MSNGSEGMSEEEYEVAMGALNGKEPVPGLTEEDLAAMGMSPSVDPPTHDEQPAQVVLGGLDMAPLVVADDVRYLDTEGNDVTEEVIANNMEQAIIDRTER